jgi:hypothetical protein
MTEKEAWPLPQYSVCDWCTKGCPNQTCHVFRSVLQVIPDTMFGLLEQIMEVEGSMAELPTRLDKEHISSLFFVY